MNGARERRVPARARIDVQGVSLSYGDRAVVDDVSFTAVGGDLVALVGPNGSGKSTLLRGVARSKRLDRGQVCLDGMDLATLRPRALARRVAMLPQWLDADLDLTVGELVWRGRHPHRSRFGPPTDADRHAVAWAIDATDVRHFVHRSLASLSGGERQRAWIALTLAQEPDVLLLDEPISALDLRHQVEVMSLLRRLAHDGIVVVVVLHDLLFAARYADRVLALDRGRLALDATPGDALATDILERVFGLPMTEVADPETGQRLPIPRLRR